jgi:molybdopterin converting factor small subunit
MPNPPEMEAKTLLVNCRNADSDGVLNEGDVLHVFPPINPGRF